jgi:hypothetical protein
VPATPFHVPPAALAAWPVRRHLDLPALLLAGVVIDVEPGLAMLLGLGPPPHGPAHTLVGATAVGALTGWLLWRLRGPLGRVLGGRYDLRAGVAVRSGAVGCWLHVLLDAVMYAHLRPFWPLAANPLHVPGSGPALHAAAAVLLVPAALLLVRARAWRTVAERLTLGLLAASAVGMAAVAAARGT